MPSKQDISNAEVFLKFASFPTIYYIYCSETKGINKYKFLVFFPSEKEDEVLFLMINSKKYFYGDSGEIKIMANEMPCLQRDSFLDCRECFVISKEELIFRIASNINNYDKGVFPKALYPRVVEAVSKSVTIEKRYKRMILFSLKSNK